MPKTIFEEDEVLVSTEDLPSCSLYEIGQALWKVLKYAERKLLNNNEDGDTKGILNTISRLKDAVYHNTGYNGF